MVINLLIFYVTGRDYERRIDSCYYVPTLGNPWIYVMKDELLEANSNEVNN